MKKSEARDLLAMQQFSDRLLERASQDQESGVSPELVSEDESAWTMIRLTNRAFARAREVAKARARSSRSR